MREYFLPGFWESVDVVQHRVMLLKVASGQVDVRWTAAAHCHSWRGWGSLALQQMAVIYWAFKFNDWIHCFVSCAKNLSGFFWNVLVSADKPEVNEEERTCRGLSVGLKYSSQDSSLTNHCVWLVKPPKLKRESDICDKATVKYKGVMWRNMLCTSVFEV